MVIQESLAVGNCRSLVVFSSGEIDMKYLFITYVVFTGFLGKWEKSLVSVKDRVRIRGNSNPASNPVNISTP